MISLRNIFCPIVIILALCGVLHADIVEGFDPGNGSYLDITSSPRTSADTGYEWRGYHGGALWEMSMYDAKGTSIADGVLDLSGNNAPSGFDNLNAWTVFNGDYIEGLSAVEFQWQSPDKAAHDCWQHRSPDQSQARPGRPVPVPLYRRPAPSRP